MPSTKSTVLILGGKDKGNDYTEILPLVKKKVKAIVAMGLHNEKILDFFSKEVPEIVSTDSLADAVDACRRLSSEGDTVLLSPCCASFDLFHSYEDRGRRFKDAVRALNPATDHACYIHLSPYPAIHPIYRHSLHLHNSRHHCII